MILPSLEVIEEGVRRLEKRIARREAQGKRVNKSRVRLFVAQLEYIARCLFECKREGISLTDEDDLMLAELATELERLLYGGDQ